MLEITESVPTAAVTNVNVGNLASEPIVAPTPKTKRKLKSEDDGLTKQQRYLKTYVDKLCFLLLTNIQKAIQRQKLKMRSECAIDVPKSMFMSLIVNQSNRTYRK